MKLEDLVHEAPGNQRCALQKNTQPCSRHAQCCVPVVLGGWGVGTGKGRRQEAGGRRVAYSQETPVLWWLLVISS